MSIHIEKENLFAPKFSKDGYEASIHLPTIKGLKVLCLGAFDPDDMRGKNNTLSKLKKVRHHKTTKLRYSLEETDDEQENTNFVLDEDTGCLSVSDAQIEKGKHILTVLVSDSLHSTSTELVLSVSDKAENSLQFSQKRYFAHVIENSVKQLNLLRVEVVNLEERKNIRFEMLNPNDYLLIKPTSGVVQTTGKAFDREEKDHYSLIVQVSYL